MMAKLFLGLGTNQSRRARMLAEARGMCQYRLGKIIGISPIYTTAAWGKTDQADFLNQVIVVETDLPPENCLKVVLAIERELGRVRMERWGPRVIDIDLLYYDDRIVRTDNLQIPHPRISERNFVLQPLLDVAPNKVDPVSGRSVVDLLNNSKDELAVTLWNGS